MLNRNQERKMAKIRTTNCYKSARYHKIKFYKMLKELAEGGNVDALYRMIQLGEFQIDEENEMEA